MSRSRIAISIGLGATLAGLTVAVAGCQSTQATSAEREAAGQKLIESDKGLKVNQENSDIKVVDTTLLTDVNGSAVVAELKNTSDQGFANVPILVEVDDAKGKSVFKNNLPGLEPALTQIPEIGPGETVDWVNDQILSTGKPDSVKVKVGVSDEALPSSPPEIELGAPKLSVDRYSGAEVSGDAENRSQVEQTDVTVFAVARKGDEVVAAGRGGLRRLPVDPDRPATYHVFFIGDPEGADIEVNAPPAQLR